MAESEIKSDAHGWRPIETAPKDGTPVDLWRVLREPRTHGRNRITAMWSTAHQDWIWPSDLNIVNNWPYDDGIGWVYDGDFYADEESFTHWMPLPPPPERPA